MHSWRTAWKAKRAEEGLSPYNQAHALIQQHRGNARRALAEAWKKSEGASTKETEERWRKIAEAIQNMT
jgi:hypothetical protein